MHSHTLHLKWEPCVPFLFYRWRPGNRCACLFKWWRWVVVAEGIDTGFGRATVYEYFPTAAMAAHWMAEHAQEAAEREGGGA